MYYDPYSNEPCRPSCGMRGEHDQIAILQSVCITARVEGLLAHIDVKQVYHYPKPAENKVQKALGNLFRQAPAAPENMEVVYTFPLPHKATLLGLSAELAGKAIAAEIAAVRQADDQYEQAISSGDSALLLKEVEAGLFSLRLGNLLQGETATVTFSYALLLEWQDDQLRLHLPTTLTPESVNNSNSPTHGTVHNSLLAEYPLTVDIHIDGALANSEINSPSHPVTATPTRTGKRLTLQRQAFLDRDFILTIRNAQQPPTALCSPDGTAFAALATFHIPPNPAYEPMPLALKILVDCSSSMAGDAITQTRHAIDKILSELQADDCFNLGFFGDTYVQLFPCLRQTNARSLKKAREKLQEINADMGTTSANAALAATYAISNRESDNTRRETCLLFITDGEFPLGKNMVEQAIKSGHRVFTVGVGNAVNENALQQLASSTGGACELVSPKEDVTQRIVKQFHRMRQPKVNTIKVIWPSQCEWEGTTSTSAFSGDTLHAFATSNKPFQGNVRLQAQFDDGTIVSASTSIQQTRIPSLQQVVVAQQLPDCETATGLALALRYQLLSEWTNYIAVAQRKSKTTALPGLHNVPHMVAAGWRGTSSICAIEDKPNDNARHSYAATLGGPRGYAADNKILFDNTQHYLTPGQFILETVDEIATGTTLNQQAIDQLLDILTEETSENIGQDLRDLAEFSTYSLPQIVCAFLFALAKTKAADRLRDGEFTRLMTYWEAADKPQALLSCLTECLNKTIAEEWYWQEPELDESEYR